ncbi:MAG: DUF1214 domain-containing protein [Gammaproteobacteria bacterium]
MKRKGTKGSGAGAGPENPGRRRIIAASSSAMAVAAMAADPPAARPDAASSGSAVLDAAWASYWGDFAKIRAMVHDNPLYGHDEGTRTDANHWLHQMLYVGHSLAVQPRQLYPIFYSTVFQYPLHNTFGMPAPDNTFGLALIDGTRKYRIWGRRNNVHSVTIVVHHGFWGDANSDMMKEYQLDDFELAADGSYEIIASAQRVPGNWIEIDPASRNVAIIVRHSHLDWEKEQKAEMHIERVDLDDDRPNPRLGEAELAARIVTAGRVMLRMAHMNNLVPGAILGNTGGAYNTFVDLNGPAVNKFGTFSRAHYCNAVYEFAAGEALIIEAADPGPETWFFNFQLGDIWYQTDDYVFHQTSLNSSQVARDADGAVRAVIAERDPGVPNWLDPLERRFGVVVFRVYGPAQVRMPVVKRVPAADLRAHLPADTPVVTGNQRREALRRRRQGAMRRFGF